MRRPLVLACVAAVALVACDGDEPRPPQASPSTTVSDPPTTSPSPSVIPSPSPSPSSPSPTATPEPILDLPDDAPVVVDEPTEVSDVDVGNLEPLVPPGATIVASVAGSDRVALTWTRGDPFSAEHGFAVWLPDDATWRVAYAFTEPPRKGVLGVSFDESDLTGDDVSEIVTRAETGGSGACATWRVVAVDDGQAAEIWRRKGCDTEVIAAAGDLRVREAVFEPDDAHCCPSAFRTTTLRWDGELFAVVDVVEEPTGN